MSGATAPEPGTPAAAEVPVPAAGSGTPLPALPAGEPASTAARAPVRRRGPAFVLRFAMFVFFGLFYAYDLFEAISNLLGVSAQLNRYNVAAAKVGLSAVAVPWSLLIANVALPLVALLAAVLLARARGTGIAALVLLAGLATVAALTLTFSALL